ncbi:hypothetical protein BA893_03320 [Vibrio natriegens]|uniref:hypothetical protein n=1 Tax=Vibrio natriegens TaxID=691 RepID=UPI0008040A7B|nr:hypothetical protein [Vibrio natriegens]ANQ20757.1 hypothetical protein BA893_03320 [Vibrio natriegens]
MSKLLKLKNWLSLDDGAQTISTLLGESVGVADLYRFAIDGHITLSINLVNPTPVRKVSLIRAEDIQHKTLIAKRKNFPQGLRVNVPLAEYPISKKYWVESESKDWNNVKGVYDLAMVGAEKDEIAQLIYPDSIVEIPIFAGFYIQKGEQIYKLQVLHKPDASHAQRTLINNENGIEGEEDSTLKRLKPRILPQAVSASSLRDHEYELVIRTGEVTRFIQSLQDEPTPSLQDEKALSPRERGTLLTIIGAFCNNMGIDPLDKGSTSPIAKMLELNGTPMKFDTIKKHLDQVPDAVERRRK